MLLAASTAIAISAIVASAVVALFSTIGGWVFQLRVDRRRAERDRAERDRAEVRLALEDGSRALHEWDEALAAKRTAAARLQDAGVWQAMTDLEKSGEFASMSAGLLSEDELRVPHRVRKAIKDIDESESDLRQVATDARRAVAIVDTRLRFLLNDDHPLVAAWDERVKKLRENHELADSQLAGGRLDENPSYIGDFVVRTRFRYAVSDFAHSPAPGTALPKAAPASERRPPGSRRA
jgi:hypothetical protein